MIIQSKRCTRCNAVKPLDAFWKKARGKYGRMEHCIQCKSEDARAYRQKHAEKLREAALSRYYRKANTPEAKKRLVEYQRERITGVNPEQYAEMVRERNGQCDICGDRPQKPLGVDHDHATGFVRGLLCSKCNTTLGAMKDSPDLLNRAADYLVDANERYEQRAPEVFESIDEAGIQLEIFCDDRHWTHRMPELVKKGESHYFSKLTEEKVRQAKQMASTGMSYGKIGNALGVDRSTIGYIMRGDTWRHVK